MYKIHYIQYNIHLFLSYNFIFQILIVKSQCFQNCSLSLSLLPLHLPLTISLFLALSLSFPISLSLPIFLSLPLSLSLTVALHSSAIKQWPAKPSSREDAVKWFIESERLQNAGIDPTTEKPYDWLHGQFVFRSFMPINTCFLNR